MLFECAFLYLQVEINTLKESILSRLLQCLTPPLQAPESYKNVTDVVNTCHDAGISKKAIKLRPIAVIKG